MTLFGLFVGYVILLCGGGGITLLLKRGEARLNVIECAGLAWLFGCGLVSLTLWVLGLCASGVILPSVAGCFCLGLGYAGWRAQRNAGATFYCPSLSGLTNWMLAGAIVLQMAVVLWMALQRPLGWDGLLMWEAKARFALLSDNVLPAQYHSAAYGFTHPEYPLGIPFTELWLYLWMGEAHQLWIKILFATFYVAGILLLVNCAVRLTGDCRLGLLVGILFFFVPTEVGGLGSAASGYVDFPLSIFYLVVVAYLVLALRSRDFVAEFRVYAAALALLPWLKREGMILWLVGAALGVLAVLIRRKRPVLLFFLAPGMLLAGGWNLYLRHLHLEMPPEFTPSIPLLSQNAGRLLATWSAMLAETAGLKAWGIFWLIALVAVIYLASQWRNLTAIALLLAALLPIAAYSSIYIFSTAADYLVHIKLSLPRLLMHVVPVIWLGVAVAVARPWRQRDVTSWS